MKHYHINSSLLLVLTPFLLQSSQVSADPSTNSFANKAEDKVGDSLEEVAGMVRNTLSAYESKVNVISFECLT